MNCQDLYHRFAHQENLVGAVMMVVAVLELKPQHVHLGKQLRLVDQPSLMSADHYFRQDIPSDTFDFRAEQHLSMLASMKEYHRFRKFGFVRYPYHTHQARSAHQFDLNEYANDL